VKKNQTEVFKANHQKSSQGVKKKFYRSSSKLFQEKQTEFLKVNPQDSFKKMNKKFFKIIQP
jgi:hypothetical protein